MKARRTQVLTLKSSEEGKSEDEFDVEKFAGEMQAKMEKSSDAFAEDLKNKLDTIAQKETEELDTVVQFLKEDLDATKKILTDERRILNMGVDALKDFAEDIIMGKVSVYETTGMNPREIDLLSTADAEDVKDMLWGKGALTPNAKKAKADFLENIDEVLSRLNSAQNAYPAQAESLNVEASIMIRQMLDQFKEVPYKTQETIMFFDDVSQAVWRKYLKEAGYSAATMKTNEERQQVFESNLQKALDDQSAGYESLTASIKADIRKELAPTFSKDETAKRFADDREVDDEINQKMSEPDQVVAALEKQMQMMMSGATDKSEKRDLGRTVVIGGEESTICKMVVEKLGDSGAQVEVLSPEKLKELTRYDADKDYKDVGTIICAANEAEKKPAFGFLPAGGKGGLAPETLEKLLKSGTAIKQVVLLSSVGTLRADKSPFSMRNVLGDLDRQRSLEQVVQLLSETRGFDYVVIRTGKYTSNTGKKPALNLNPGDDFDGESTYESAAESVMQSLFNQPAARNSSFSIESVPGSKMQQEDYDDLFLKLDGPEICRIPLQGSDINTGWINRWSDLWLQKGSGLTTPVKITSLENGVRLQFIPSKTGNFASFKEEKQAQKAKEKGKPVATRGSVSDEQGGLEIVVETKPYQRIRICRCSYARNAIIKEMSEETIVNRLKKDLQSYSKI